MTELFPGLENLKGGRKQIWLRLHREQVLNYYFENGEEATRKEFHLKPWTLEKLLSPPKKMQPKFTKLDKVLSRLEIVEEGSRQTYLKVSKMEKQYNTFVDTLGDRVFYKLIALLKAAMSNLELPKELEIEKEPDPLDITDFLKKLDSKAKKLSLYGMSSNLNSAPLDLLKPPTEVGLLEQALDQGTSLSAGQKEPPNDIKKHKRKQK